MSRSFDFFADQVFEERLFKIRHFAQLFQDPFSSSQQYINQTMGLTLLQHLKKLNSKLVTNFLIVFVWVLSHFALGSQNQQGFRYRLSSLRHLFFLAVCRKVESNLQLYTMSAHSTSSLSLAAFYFWFQFFIPSSNNFLLRLVLLWFCFSLPVIFFFQQ